MNNTAKFCFDDLTFSRFPLSFFFFFLFCLFVCFLLHLAAVFSLINGCGSSFANRQRRWSNARFQSPLVSVKIWVLNREGSKTWIQSMLLSAVGSNEASWAVCRFPSRNPGKPATGSKIAKSASILVLFYAKSE